MADTDANRLLLTFEDFLPTVSIETLLDTYAVLAALAQDCTEETRQMCSKRCNQILNEAYSRFKPNTVYIATVYRYGNREGHSYVVGAFSEEHLATQAVNYEYGMRGGKYRGEVLKCKVDEYIQTKGYPHDVVVYSDDIRFPSEGAIHEDDI
jgi:hypothetical protein